MGREFKEFLLRGNVADLAVAVVIGAALVAVVNALADFITPIIATIGGEPDFAALDLEINDSSFKYGHFINAVLSFLLIAAVIFFFVLKPMNYLMQRSRREPPMDPTTRKCPECLSEIALDARRCAFCIAVLVSA